MDKETLLKKLQTPSQVDNAKIQLGDIDDSGKAKKFKSRFIQAGVAGYPGTFGNVLVKKETLDKYINTMVGVPVIINHKDVTVDNADDLRVGVVSDVYFNEKDGWYWCNGVIWNETAQDLIKDKGWSVSCSYDALECEDEGGSENNIKYDREFTKMNFTHLALVSNPRYERANIVFNSKVDNGWITTDKLDENGAPIRVWIEGYYGQSKAERNRKSDILSNFKEGSPIKFDFTHTRSKITSEQQDIIKKTVNNILSSFVSNPVAQVEIRSIGGGALGLCTSSANASIVGLDSSLFSGKMTQDKWEKSIKDGFHPKTDKKDMVKSVLTHEMGHAISVNTKNKDFWKDAEKTYNNYLKEIKKEDVKNSDFISNYARVNKYEFVAEAFSQGMLSKKYGKYTKEIMDAVDKHLAKASQLKLVATNKKDTEDVIIWEENFGAGYPIDEEAYDKSKEKQQEKTKEKQKNVDNSLENSLEELITTYEPTKADLPILRGLVEIFNNKDKKEFVTVGEGESAHAIPVDYLKKDKKEKKISHADRIEKIFDKLDRYEDKADEILSNGVLGHGDITSIMGDKSILEEYVNKQPAVDKIAEAIYNDELELTSTLKHKIGKLLRNKENMDLDEFTEKIYQSFRGIK